MYADEKTAEERTVEATRVMRKHPSKVPCIIEPASDRLPVPGRRKWLLPRQATVATVLGIVRKSVELRQDRALFVSVGGGILPKVSDLLEDVYEAHRDPTGMLHFHYDVERTFG